MLTEEAEREKVDRTTEHHLPDKEKRDDLTVLETEHTSKKWTVFCFIMTERNKKKKENAWVFALSLSNNCQEVNRINNCNLNNLYLNIVFCNLSYILALKSMCISPLNVALFVKKIIYKKKFKSKTHKFKVLTFNRHVIAI